MKSFVFWLKFHWSWFPKVQLTMIEHWLRLRLGAEKATSHYLNQCWTDSLTHICGIGGRWVRSVSYGEHACPNVTDTSSWGLFPAKMASNAENVSIWWRHHDSGPGSIIMEFAGPISMWLMGHSMLLELRRKRPPVASLHARKPLNRKASWR